MTWNSHGIWCWFGSNCHQVKLWREVIEFPWESLSHFYKEWLKDHLKNCIFLSQIDLVAVWSKSTPNSMTIPCHLSRFYLSSMQKTWHGFWASSSHGISMEFAKKMMGFPVRIWSHFRPNCPQKDKKETLPHFLQGFLDHSQPPLQTHSYIKKILNFTEKSTYNASNLYIE